LFGHVKGAFTGANEAKKGLIELAHKGTLFLDEIADMPMGQQTKLLRVLQEKAVRPVGGKETVPVDFRLITATHRDLRTCIAEGTFREDLYHRIAQLVVTMPTLEDRPEDIEPIANRFLSEVAAQQGTTVKRLSPESLALLQSRPYKGNVRELQNCLTSAIFATGCGPVITEDIILSVLEQKAETEQPRNNGPENFVPPPPDAHVHTGLRDAIQSYERLILEKAHKQFAGNRSQMADFLDIPKRTLVNKLHQHNINLSGDIL
jgi:sigma-54-specific transcriptional regulator